MFILSYLIRKVKYIEHKKVNIALLYKESAATYPCGGLRFNGVYSPCLDLIGTDSRLKEVRRLKKLAPVQQPDLECLQR